MKLSATARGPDGLKKKLFERAMGGAFDARLRAAAEQLRRQAIESLADAAPGDMTPADAAAAIRVEPLPEGRGYSVVADTPNAWELEFGARGRAATAWFTSALAAALPMMRARLRRRNDRGTQQGQRP